jgi:putative two-component system response regulator
MEAPGQVSARNTMNGRILVVDDEPANCELLRRFLERDHYLVETASDGEAALRAAASSQHDLILLDGIDGIEVCRQIKQSPATRLTPVILLTGLDRSVHRIKGIRAGADDFLSKPFESHELAARVSSLIRIKRYTDDLETAESVILSLALTVEARDPYTDGHCQRLAGYAVALGRELGMSVEDTAALRRGGYLHDVGKIGVPDAILLKPGPLTASEFDIVKTHPAIGERLCGDLRALRTVKPIIRGHHERLDGSGYPDGLSGDEIPVGAQIVAVADTYDAITTSRPYRAALSRAAAFDEIDRDVLGGRFAARIVAPFRALERDGTLQRIADEISPGARM